MQGPKDNWLGTTALRFRVEDWQAFVPGPAGQALEYAGPQDAVQQATNVPTLLRRRVSAIGQSALRAAFQTRGPAAPRFVFCSRHGEFDRTHSLLQSIARNEPVSPADFSLSVHNALAGLLSIALRNASGHTAIAAGEDSLGYGLLEAATCLTESPGEKVLVVYFDAPLPDIYADVVDDAPASLALALLLAPGAGRAGDVVMSYEPGRGMEKSACPDRYAGEIVAFLGGGSDALRIAGRQMTWRWARAA